MNTETLILAQLNLECIRLNNQGYLAQFQCDNPDTVSRLYIFHDGKKYYRYLQENVPSVLRQHLKLLRKNVLFEDIEQIQQTLGEHKPCQSIFRGRTYSFSEDNLNRPFDDKDIDYHSSNCEIVINREVVASCTSVREDERAAEAWVHTNEAFRGQGFGKRVTLAWARQVAQKGKIAFYTHSVDNIASQKLVEKLPFVWRYDLVSYD